MLAHAHRQSQSKSSEPFRGTILPGASHHAPGFCSSPAPTMGGGAWLFPIILAVLILGAVLLAIAGCMATASVERRPDGTTSVRASWPPKSTAPALLMGSGPTTQPALGLKWTWPTPTQAQLTSERVKPLMWWGILTLLAGGALWAVRSWLPMLALPTTITTIPLLLGAAMIAAAVFLPQIQIPSWAWLAALGVGAALILPGWISNHKAKKTPPPTPGATP